MYLSTVTERLEQEIKDLEGKQFSNPVENTSTEQENETVLEAPETEDEVTQEKDLLDSENDSADKDSENLESDTSIAQEEEQATDNEEPSVTPQRNNWKKDYQQLDKRFRNLKASNDSTIFSLRKDLANALKNEGTIRTKLGEANNELNQMKSKVDIYSDLLSDDEKDILGEDTLSSFKKLNKAAVDSAVAPLREQLEEARKERDARAQEAASSHEQQASSNFLSRLGDLVPDYNTLDTNPEFLNYMKNVDEFTGDQRESIFKRAQSIGDVGRVAQFFIEFKKLKNAGKDALNKRVTPSTSASAQTSRTTTTNNSPKKQYVSMAGYDKFCSDVSKGRYKGREKEVKQIEAAVALAHSEGRIVA